MSKTLYHRAVIVMESGAKFGVNGTLKDLKEKAVLASLSWNLTHTEHPNGGVRIVRIYRVSNGQFLDAVITDQHYQDLVGVAFNGKYYPVRIWWLMKDWYSMMPEMYKTLPLIHKYIEHRIKQVLSDWRKKIYPNVTGRQLYPPENLFDWPLIHLDYSCWRNHTEHDGE